VDEEFKHFDLKWTDFEGMQEVPIPTDDPVNAKIKDMCRLAFKTMMGCIG